MTEVGGRQPVTATTLFQAASNSKPVTVSAMLRLVEKGTLSLDANVNQYLTSWKLPENEFTKQIPVTLRRLATHAGGTTVSGFQGYKVGAPRWGARRFGNAPLAKVRLTHSCRKALP